MDSEKKPDNLEENLSNELLRENLYEAIAEIRECLPYLKEFKSFYASGININEPGGGMINSATLKRILGISDRTLSRWRTAKIIPYERFGTDCYYSYDELIRYFSRTNVILGRGITGAEALSRLRSFKMGLQFHAAATASQFKTLAQIAH